MHRYRFGATAAFLATVLAACSPAQNWRQVAFDGTTLQAQLPCKPDRTTREVPLGGVPVSLQVAGCESGEAMLVLMTAALAPGADAQAVLVGWRQATLAHLQAPAEGGQVSAWVGDGWLRLAAAVQQSSAGRQADGRAVMAHMAWAAAAEGDHVRVVHAAVYAPRARPELAQALMESLKP
ncbi:MAG: hypothetical protein FJY36_06845 [Betaproteobacteria bacterium]|nr:hypothetical protein [Betaproteobacteria bacterium]